MARYTLAVEGFISFSVEADTEEEAIEKGGELAGRSFVGTLHRREDAIAWASGTHLPEHEDGREMEPLPKEAA